MREYPVNSFRSRWGSRSPGYPSEAMAYAGGYASRLRAEEDADRGRRIRILERELELEQQRQADIDYCETRLRLTDTE